MSHPRNTAAPRHAEEGERGYVLKSWTEAMHKHHARTPWAVYKRLVVPSLRAVLDRSEVLVSHLPDGLIAGWIAIERKPRVGAVHWVHCRYRHPSTHELLRRRGVMTELLDAADLGSRIVYTHTDADGLHKTLAEWLASRDVTALHLPYVEWKK